MSFFFQISIEWLRMNMRFAEQTRMGMFHFGKIGFAILIFILSHSIKLKCFILNQFKIFQMLNLQIYSACIQCAWMSAFGTIHVIFPASKSISGSSLYKYVKFIVIYKRNKFNLKKNKFFKCWKKISSHSCEPTCAFSGEIEKSHFMQEYSAASSDDA